MSDFKIGYVFGPLLGSLQDGGRIDSPSLKVPSRNFEIRPDPVPTQGVKMKRWQKISENLVRGDVSRERARVRRGLDEIAWAHYEAARQPLQFKHAGLLYSLEATQGGRTISQVFPRRPLVGCPGGAMVGDSGIPHRGSLRWSNRYRFPLLVPGWVYRGER